MHVHQLITLVFAVGLASAAAADDTRTERRTFSLPQTEALGIPISDAVLVGDTLYLSGNGGIDLSTMEVPEDPKEIEVTSKATIRHALSSDPGNCCSVCDSKSRLSR